MSLQVYERALDFLVRSGIDQTRLLGGEPTLHPQFPHFIDLALERGFKILVFSNGLMDEKVLRHLEKVPPERLKVLINAVIPDTAQPEEYNRQCEVFRRLGDRVILGVNIYTPAVKPDFLIDLIREFNLSLTIRLGLAHPCLTEDNQYLHSRYYETVGRDIASFMEQYRGENLKLEFDCGFVPCMFSEDALAAMGKAAENIGRRCNPILDILPDGSVIPCYPLAGLYSSSLSPVREAEALREEFEGILNPYRNIGIFRECNSCGFRREGLCHGGCLSAAMKRLRNSKFEINAPSSAGQRLSHITSGATKDIYLGQNDQCSEPAAGSKKKWIVPYIDQPIFFWQKLAEDFPGRIQEVYFPLPGVDFGSGRPKQPDGHLEDFLRNSPFELAALINPVVLPQPVRQVGPSAVEALKRLRGEYGLAGVTVASLQLAEYIRKSIPGLSITASVLMDVHQPRQAMMLNGICDNLVPATRIMRDLPALKALRTSFTGRIRLIVNEACLPDCLFRTQHFFEMTVSGEYPPSLCEDLLKKNPWLRLTGAWVLPQHLSLYQGVYDELKLAGRVTLRHPENYRRVLGAYLGGKSMFPNEIGGGPASVLEPIEIAEDFYEKTLSCGRRCHSCSVCADYYERSKKRFADNTCLKKIRDEAWL
jgi:radical SAM protein with 4Fe4S-binding SPASM domain